MSRESQKAERTKRAAKRRARKQKAKVALTRAVEADSILAAEKARAEQRIAEANAKQAGLRANLDETGQVVEQKAATIESLTVELAATNKDMMWLIGERAAESKARETAEIKVRVLEAKVRKQALAIDGLNATCDARAKTIADLRAQDMEAVPLRRRLKERADEIQALRTQLSQAHAQIPPKPLTLGVTP